MPFIPARSLQFLPLLAAGIVSSATAQSEPQDSAYHRRTNPDIVVTALLPRTQTDVLAGVSVVSGEELARDLRTTIGETLMRQPGVSSTSFGPNASRPILRGLQGERVRILTDGIGSFDVSNTSVDHAVAINPLTAERIEVLRGPAALLYGSSAIGGVVNVIDARIPHRIPDEAVHVEGLATYGSAADERTVSGKAEAPLGGGFVAHIDGSWSKSNDLRTGGYILAGPLREIAAQSDEEEIQENARLRGRLPNSAAETWEIAGALAYIGEGGSLGISIAHSENTYGVPARLEVLEEHEDQAEEGDGEEHGHAHENVTLDMRQTRVDMRGEIYARGSFIDKIRLRAGYADYRHDEIEDSGEIGTSFYAKGIEGRSELIQTKRGGWDGVIGAQLYARDFHIVGEEKFLPANSTTQFGLFTLQSLDLGTIRLEAGGRYEHTRASAKADEDLNFDAIARSFDAFSFSAGASYEIVPGWRTGLNVVRSTRAPSAEELFARGPHAGTQAFELGNPDFGKEKSWGIEGSLRGGGPNYKIALSGFYNWFDGYIYDTLVADDACLAVTDDLEFPCFQYNQAKARTYGFEAEASATVAQWGETALALDASADYVRARIVGSGPAPRIPPLRLLGGAELSNDRWSARIEGEHGFAQNRVAALETTTPAYTLVNASLSYKPIAGNEATSITMSANNIFDTTVRRAASIMKDYAPLAGRDIRVTARFGF
tara:strand:+ start:5577 stop:7724 length:2148 start_codon:yes stop_codon:yes gene_type:complete